MLDEDFEPDSVSDDGLSYIDSVHFYTGRERDPETGLQLNRRRFYDPPLGRWVTRDPIEYLGGPNLYEHVLSKPINYIDPTGLIITEPPRLPRKPAKCGECPNEKEYDPATQCCENGQVVGKVPIWVCKAGLGGDDSTLGGYCKVIGGGGGSLGPVGHSYIVCEDPVQNPLTKEKYGFHPWPFDEWSWPTCGPGYVNRETNRDPNHPWTKCTKRMVCPAQKDKMCQGGWSQDDRYNMFGTRCGLGINCHQWAAQ